MADGIFFVHRIFGSGAAVACGDKERVVAEAAVAARVKGNRAVPQALRDERQRVVGVAQVNDEADVIGAAVGDVFQRGEQFAVVARIALTAVTRGIDAGRAAKRRDAEAGIVGYRRPLCRAAWRALIRAFSTKVSPVSGISSMP